MEPMESWEVDDLLIKTNKLLVKYRFREAGAKLARHRVVLQAFGCDASCSAGVLRDSGLATTGAALRKFYLWHSVLETSMENPCVHVSQRRCRQTPRSRCTLVSIN